MWKIIPVLLLLWILNSCSSNSASVHAKDVKTDTIKSDSIHSVPGKFHSIHLKNADTLKGEDRFTGQWSKDDVHLCHYIEIYGDTSLFCPTCNQLGLQCRNKYHGDTLFLYVISTDQGRGFMGPKYYPPKPKSLFAKCYIVGDTALRIIYTQSMYSKNIADLELDTVLYKYE